MKPHECQNNWPRIYQLMLSLVLWDDIGYKYIMAEIQDCKICLKNALEIVLYLHVNGYALHSGGLDRAADHLTDELERLLMPSEKTANRLAELDRQNRVNDEK
jgi:hypothetical protein